MDDDEKARGMDLEWENRVLCSDESCIGTIGPDGRCRECGRPYEGVLPGRTESTPPTEAIGENDGETDTSGDPSAPAYAIDDLIEEDPTSVADDDWERRTLCPDESCIGVIGPDGCCKECGRRL
jgi:hypothetical protein